MTTLSSNILIGNSGNNWLDGGTGADSMSGGVGNDTYIVDNAADVVVEQADEGTDNVQSGVSYTLSANVENLTLTGSASINGTGNDLNNVITGNTGNNVLFGLAGNDTLVGGSGNDTLDGGTGADVMAGGAGNDTFVVDEAGDRVTENANEGTDLVQSSITYTLTNNVENLTLTGSADIDGTGNTLNNVITGNSGINTLDGGAGNDTINAGAGADILYGGDGNDTLNGGLDADSMTGGVGNDTYVVDNAGDLVSENANEGVDLVQSSITYTLTDHVENLNLTGSANIQGTGNVLDNVVTGNGGINILYGLEGNDTLNGGSGADTLMGGIGNDTYVVDNTGDVVVEAVNEGTDTVQASVTYTLSAEVENLTLTGFSGINGTGNELDNIITGNAGNNVLDGAAGADTMAGGVGNDTYVVDDAGDLVNENLYGGTDLVQSSISHVLTANVENLTLIGASAIDGTGNGLANVITGNATSNVIDGGAGDDTLHAGAGDDTLEGGVGNDTLDGGTGADLMTGGAGNDTYVVDDVGDVVIENANEGIDHVQSAITYTLTDNVENLALTGGASLTGTGNALNNVVAGNTGTNTLYGLEGNDTLDGGAGADTLIGGVGDDTYIVDNADDVVFENADEGADLIQASVTYTLTDNIENLTLTGTASVNGTGNELGNIIIGNGGNNVLSGLAGDDTLTGNSGNDTLDGGAGADVMAGGVGNDTYVVDEAGDLVSEALNAGIDLVRSSISYALTNNVENLTLVGAADLNGTGNNLNNVITGNAGNNLLDGSAGADTLIGGAGDDIYIVDNPGDVVSEGGGGGHDTVLSSVTYTLSDNVENLQFTGSANINGTGNGGDNVLIGNAGANAIFGGGGNDQLDGGAGNDSMAGGIGDDTYVVDAAGDSVMELAGEGTDTVRASVTHALGDNLENLVLIGASDIDGTGNALDNVITGNVGNNVLSGGLGNDTLSSGAGADLMLGGEGDDLYRFNTGDGNDRIADLQGFNTLHMGGGLTEGSLEAERVGDDMVIHVLGTEDFVTLENWFTQTDTNGINMMTFDDGTVLDREGIALLINRPPVAAADSITVFEDGGALNVLTTFLLANDTDPNPGDVLSVLSVGESAVGASVSLDNGQVSYDIGNAFQELAEGESIQDSFTYVVSDQEGATAVGLVQVNIVGVNDAPVTGSDAAIVVEDWQTAASGNVLANDSDVDNGTMLQVAAPGEYAGDYGDLSIETDGSYAYSLDNGSQAVQSLGRDTLVVERFGYTASDGLVGTSDVLEVFLHGVNDAPIVAKPPADQNFTFNKPFSWVLPEGSFTDVDAGDTLSYTATLADGSPLPDWLHFDAETLSFSGMVPKSLLTVDVTVTATDSVAATGSTEGSLSASDSFSLTISHGNQGVGNGEDAAPAGQDSNFNDGAGTSPGNPGAKGGKSSGGTPSPTPPAAVNQANSQSQTDGASDSSQNSEVEDGVQPASPPQQELPSYLGASDWEQVYAAYSNSASSSDPAVMFSQWLEMDLAISRALAAEQSLMPLDEAGGADTSVLKNGFLGSRLVYGKDALSLLSGSGQSLQNFQGLSEGLERIG